MVKSNKAIIASFTIGILCLNNSAIAVDEHSQANEVSNKHNTSSKVVVLYDDGSISTLRTPQSFLEKQPTTQWHKEIGNIDTTAQAQTPKKADNQDQLNEVKATPVPEPTIFSMVLAGIGLLLMWSKLFRNRN